MSRGYADDFLTTDPEEMKLFSFSQAIKYKIGRYYI